MKNILVVDDNKCIRDVVSLIVDSFFGGCSVYTAENGAQGARLFDSLPIDVVVTDLSMPVMDGYQFIEYIRGKFSRVPIIVMTADPLRGVEARLKSFGVQRCLEKPFDVKVAAEEIAAALESCRNVPVPASSGKPGVFSFGLQSA